VGSVILKKIWLHFKLITKHKWYVFKLSVKAGIPFRGIVHDLSKYSLEEFVESCKYYQGNRSPINVARKENGYSKAWLHHKGRNKHHEEYWYDWNAKEKPIIPYKYVVEMLCDHIAASQVYKGKVWTKEDPLKYWNEVETNRNLFNLKTEKFVTVIKEEIANKGIDKIINKKHLKEQYKKYCG